MMGALSEAITGCGSGLPDLLLRQWVSLFHLCSELGMAAAGVVFECLATSQNLTRLLDWRGLALP